jgi:YHS domain-containing protein
MNTPLLVVALITCTTAMPLAQPVKEPPATPAPAQPAPKADDGIDPKAARDTTHYNLDKDKLALQGYDPVAYFTEGGGKARKGSEKLTHTHRGAVYRFASQANLDTFKKNPNRYEPAYGGWCASAMADGGRKVEIDPANFKVTDNRLFLFYKSFLQDALDYWKKDEKGHTKEADEQWKKLTKEDARPGK